MSFPQPPQQPPQGQYPQYGQYQPIAPKTSPMAIVGFVMALVAIPVTFLRGFGLILNLAAFIVCLIANSQIKKSNGQLTGKGLAVAGIVITSVWFGLILLLLIMAASIIGAMLGGGM